MLKLLCISIHIPNFSLDFQNFYFSTVCTVKMVELHHYAKFCRNCFNRGRDIAIFRYFKMAAAAIFGFSKFKFFNGWNSQEGQTVSRCQISSKSFEPRPRYASFNIMLFWLENAYSRPFLGFLGTHFSQMMSLIILTPKRTILGLNHAIWAINREYFPIDFWMGLTRVLYMYFHWFNITGSQKWVLVVINMVGVNISNLSSP